MGQQRGNSGGPIEKPSSNSARGRTSARGDGGSIPVDRAADATFLMAGDPLAHSAAHCRGPAKGARWAPDQRPSDQRTRARPDHLGRGDGQTPGHPRLRGGERASSEPRYAAINHANSAPTSCIRRLATCAHPQATFAGSGGSLRLAL